MRRAAVVVMLAISGTAWADAPTLVGEPVDPVLRRECGEYADRIPAARHNLEIAMPGSKSDYRQRLADLERQNEKCIARVAAFHAQRAEQAERDKVIVAQRVEAERKQAEAAAAADARLQAMGNDPKERRVAFSALLCGWTADYNEAIHEIGEEHKAAKLGGVLDMGSVNKWQNEAMRARHQQGRANAALKQLKVKALSCKDPQVLLLAPCMTDDVQEAGSCGPDINAYYSIARGDE